MKIVGKNNSLLSDDLKTSIRPEDKLKMVESTIELDHMSNSPIDPEEVIAWLVTQPNAHGTLYLENVVRQYMSALRATPAKLQIPVRIRNVFTCHTPDELNVYWDIFLAAPNYKKVNSSISGMFSAGLGCYMRYLQHLSGKLDVQKEVVHLIERHNLEYIDQRESGGALWVIGGRELLPIMRRLRDCGLLFSFKIGGGRSSKYRDAWWYKSSERESKQKSEELKEAQPVYIASKGITNSVQYIYLKPTQSIQTLTNPVKIVPAAQLKYALDSEIIEKLSNILLSHYSNGYRLNSPIEMARFRSFAAEDLNEEITLTDEELKNYIVACGTIFEGKVYNVSTKAKERIKRLVEDYFSSGAQSIFFAEFYAKNESWLFEASVVSEEILIEVLRKLFPKLSFTQTYFGYTDASIFIVLEGEILRVWGDDVLLTYNQLSERLRYIPLERIKFLLGQNRDFIWSSVETFSHISKIKITNEERHAIREVAERDCSVIGYASITDLPLDEMAERNYELSIPAVHNAVYRICLSDKYDKKGKIVVRKGVSLDALTIMKNFCQTIDKCSLDELLNYQKEQTGEGHRWIPMEAGSTVLVRIDLTTFVADRYVNFNADIIDKTIELFVKKSYLPLKSFTTFGVFPDCGQTWNLFLLESYCRRFSQKFRFDTLTVNSRNAGAVIRNSCSMDYTEIMTDAVVNAGIPLKNTAVHRFLFENGYTGRSTNVKVNEIIDKAKAIREKRD